MIVPWWLMTGVEQVSLPTAVAHGSVVREPSRNVTAFKAMRGLWMVNKKLVSTFQHKGPGDCCEINDLFWRQPLELSRILIGDLTALLPSWVLLTCFTD